MGALKEGLDIGKAGLALARESLQIAKEQKALLQQIFDILKRNEVSAESDS